MKKVLITVVLVLVTFGSGFSFSITELYGLHGTASHTFNRNNGTIEENKFWGGGISFSNVDPSYKFIDFGVFATVNVLYHTESEIANKDGTTIISVPVHQNYDTLFSLDTLLGFRSAPTFLFLAIPVDIGVHMATEWKEPYTSFRLGIGGTIGVQFIGLFARVQVSYDFIQWDFKDSGVTSKKTNYLTFMPQFGLSFVF